MIGGFGRQQLIQQNNTIKESAAFFTVDKDQMKLDEKTAPAGEAPASYLKDERSGGSTSKECFTGTHKVPEWVGSPLSPGIMGRLAPYLAGLIEGDGSLSVHDKNSKAKRYLPKIYIIFHLNDIPLAEKLISVTEIGKLYKRTKQGCAV